MSTPFRLQAFDIITCSYHDLNGSVKTNPDGSIQYGMYMVLSVYADNVVLGCKITSNPRYADSFSILLGKDCHPFLRTDSYVQLTKPQCFFLSSVRLVGSVHMSVRRLIASRFGVLANSWYKELLALSPACVSPNMKGE